MQRVEQPHGRHAGGVVERLRENRIGSGKAEPVNVTAARDGLQPVHSSLARVKGRT